MNQQDFIERIAPGAQKAYTQSGILPSITIAQAILESNWGKSKLTQEANNLFGIKGKFLGKSYIIPTNEVVGGKTITITAAFRHYPTWDDCILDHDKVLQASRYKKARVSKDYTVQAQEIRKGGYATDPKYAEKLVILIQQWKLWKYDVMEGENVELIRCVYGGKEQKATDAIFQGGKSYIPAEVLKAIGVTVVWDAKNKIVHVAK